MLGSILAVLLLVAFPAWGADLRVLDGDTVIINGERIRLLGIDAPELRGGCAAEHRKAQAARSYLEMLLINREIVIDRDRSKRDKYGRTLAWLRVDGHDVSAEMIAAGHAREYHGGKRAGWCR